MKPKIIVLIVISVLLMLMVALSFSFAIWVSNNQQSGDNIVQSGCLSINYLEDADSIINLSNAYPISDLEGASTKVYEFSVENTCTISSLYSINIDVLNTTTLDHSLIRVMLDNNESVLLSELSQVDNEDETITTYQISSGELLPGDRIDYDFRMWVDSTTTTAQGNGKNVDVKLHIIGEAINLKLPNDGLFAYTGKVQSFVVPESGYYKFEAWGAQGGESLSKGAYTSGTIYLTQGEKFYVYVGEGNNTVPNSTSFNGGTGNNGGYPGGGATDFRLVYGNWNDINSLKSRIMVAAGSGSGSGNDNISKGAGGELVGLSGGGTSGGTQTSFGAAQDGSIVKSLFGIANGGCAGGNGYYPGGGATCTSGAGGGSSFISGYVGVNAILENGGTDANPTPSNNTLHYSEKYFINGEMIAGNLSMPTHDGTSTMIGNSGNGFAKVTRVENNPIKVHNSLDNIRYIKNCTDANSDFFGNYWNEIQAIVNGQNVAKGKNVVGTVAQQSNPGYAYSNVTDGNYNTGYGYIADDGLQCLTVDLGDNYNLDEIVAWHYYTSNRVYYNHTFSIGSTNETGTSPLSTILINNTHTLATSQGYRFSAYETIN